MSGEEMDAVIEAAGTLTMLNLSQFPLFSRDRSPDSDEHIDTPLTWVMAAGRRNK